MKNFRWSALALFGALLLTNVGAQTYELVWEDNFNGSVLDTNYWSIEEKEGIWNTGQNNEFQHYRKENVTVGDDGDGNNCLVLTAKKEDYNGYSYTSGKVITKGKAAFKQGKIEAFIKVPDLANGLWPAFWTLGYENVGWPNCGEIDILEMGHAQGITDGTQNSFIGAHLFWGNGDEGFPNYGTEFTATEDLSTGFFKHTVVWTTSKIEVYFNDAVSPYFAMDITDEQFEEFRDYPHYLLLNLAVGGSVPGISNPADITATFPASMYVDWVRVYQEVGEEDFNDSTLALFGDFGVYEEEASVEMYMNYGFDLKDNTTGLTERAGETPYEGDACLSYSATSGQAFDLRLTSGLIRNFENYTEGSLQLIIKTDITEDIQIGVKDKSGAEKLITFSTSDEDAFERDGTWQFIYIPLADLDVDVEISELVDLLVVKSTPSADGYISIDQVVVKTTVPAEGFYGIFTNNPLITEGFVVDNVNYNLYIWENSLSFNTFWPAYEGEEVYSCKSTGQKDWFGFGLNSKNPLNFSSYTNGYLNISLRSNSNDAFEIGMDTDGGTSALIVFDGSDDPYGFARDGEWHHLNIPMSDLIAKGLDINNINHVFRFGGGGSIDNIAMDNIFLSEEMPDIDNEMICYLNGLSITPASASVAVGQAKTLTAKPVNQFGNPFDNEVEWSTDGGTISNVGEFSADAVGTYTVTATQESLTAEATITVTDGSGLDDSFGKSITYLYDKHAESLTLAGLTGQNGIRIVGIDGKQIHNVQTVESTYSLPMNNTPTGVYIIQVVNGNKYHSFKFIK